MKELVLYVHGQGGSPAECEHYRPLFPGREVIGLAYRGFTPWEAGEEIRSAAEALAVGYDRITLIANSIGAYFSMNAGIDARIARACFISPIVDLEKLIGERMRLAGVTEARLKAERVIGELSWDYLCYVRQRPIQWHVPTWILYGERDELTSYETVAAFARAHGAALTVMPDGEHWFHTEEQMRFLDAWIRGCETAEHRTQTPEGSFPRCRESSREANPIQARRTNKAQV